MTNPIEITEYTLPRTDSGEIDIGVLLDLQENGLLDDCFEEFVRAIEANARVEERERIANWLNTQRIDIPATGPEFAATIRSGEAND